MPWRIARENPYGIRRYVQNHVIDGAFGVLSDDTTSRSPTATVSWNCSSTIFTTCSPPSNRRSQARPTRTASSSPTNPTTSHRGRGRRDPGGEPACHIQSRSGACQAVGELKIVSSSCATTTFSQGFPRPVAAGARRSPEKPFLTRRSSSAVVPQPALPGERQRRRRAGALQDGRPADIRLMVARWFDTIEQAGAFRAIQRGTDGILLEIRQLVEVVLPLHQAHPHHPRTRPP